MADPFDQFIGIPFLDRGRTRAGADCWGLFRLAVQEVSGVELPAYDEHYVSVAERHTNAAMIKGVVGDWQEVARGAEQRFDGIVMRDGRHESHIALVTRSGAMLHTYQGGAACIDRYSNSPFRERLIGFYRHRAFINGLD